ncbi:MAG: MFS transporter [Puniceicoccales bacterium]|jgi:POT family proton-dependent oligopeptide transporter|nr:MFS transporter [Puniceicoccales bacterium]
MPPQEQDNRFPKQVALILGNEACERFSYYGMKSLLPLYIPAVLLMTNDSTTKIIHLFGFVNYLMPMLGGWLSDRFWGRYKTILWVSLLYCVGHGVLALADLSESRDYKIGCLYAGLAFIAVGAGGIKPCVSVFMGDQFKPWQTKMIQKAYAAFYWSINLGSFTSMLIIPAVAGKIGWSWAFAIPGILMAFATFIFWCGRKHYIMFEPERNSSKREGFFTILWYAINNRGPGGFWSAARQRFSHEAVEGVIATCRVLGIFAFVPPFWALFEQHASTWVMQGKQMESLVIFGQKINASQMQAANPAFILTLVPIITLGIYPLLGKWVTPLRRMTVGLFITGFAYILVTWLQVRVESGETMSLAWQILPYLVITAGEVLVSTTGLEFAFTQAPKSMKGIITSFWLLTSALGHLLIFLITEILGDGDSSSVTSGRFLLYAGIMFVVATLFAIVASFYRYQNNNQKTA